MIKKIIEFYGEKRFYIILITLIIMWIVLIGFLYLKADEVTKDPCSVCAKRMGEEIICSSGVNSFSTKTFYPNFSISVTT